MRSARRDIVPFTNKELCTGRFEHQLRTDQGGACDPDTHTPFKNVFDATKRLIRYHVFNERRPVDLHESDAQFQLHAEALMKKKKAMEYKYQSLLIKDSMVSSCWLIIFQ